MRHVWAGLAMAVLCALPAAAQGPDRSPYPTPRPPVQAPAPQAQTQAPAPQAQTQAPAPQAQTQAAAPTQTQTPPQVTASTVTVMVRATPQAPRRSLRPVARPGATVTRASAAPQRLTEAEATQRIVTAASTATPPQSVQRQGLFGGVFRPRETRVAAGGAVVATRGASALAVPRSLRPALRPDGLERLVRAAATRTTPGRVTQSGRRGALCGSAGIIGESLSPITGRIQGCGIARPVRVREIDGITFSQPATINCEAALAIQEWLREGVVPAVGRTGGGVASLRVIASYSCRTRNSRPGARLSEHASGNAVDIAGIGLVNGQELTVLGGWRSGREGRLLQRIHAEACGPFGTVLGPNSDRFHQDHFHLDVASYRSGPYCR